ncbi:hypothetical protein Micbo1qcDRAFT_1565 [Microdochium bolleyi]|uniref:Uncharacterized protein n=1 Tax=Microdochium bolleyi TaxID=196109 RepID=A0A136JHC1_9PEZI|nr:hypothetical protein Micbo1qcDRAFT_1565 [Microdochium bolleyi]
MAAVPPIYTPKHHIRKIKPIETYQMEPPPTPGGSAAQDIFSVFEQGFEDDEEEGGDIAHDEWHPRSPVLPELLPAPELPSISPSRAWQRSAFPRHESSSPQFAGSRSPGVDPRERLIHRLNSLISQIGSDSNVDSGGLSALHGMVDRMEETLEEGSRPATREGQTQLSQGFSPRWESETGSGGRRRTKTRAARPQRTRQNHIAAEIRNQRIVQEAHELSSQMEAVAKSLLERQEETEHIHSMLLTRLEQAADKIVRLESRAAELEGERDEAEMDILNLQIHLKAIEVQMPKNIDAELRESIATWKAEWSSLRRKRALHRTESHGQDSSARRPSGPTPRRTMTSPG